MRVRTIEPNPILPEQLFTIGIMSKAWAERHGAVEVAPYTDAEIAYVEDHANGTGPFMLQDYEPGARMVLVKNADWWGLAKDPHNIDRVVFTAVADPAQRMAALLAGEIDFLHDPPFAELDRLASTPGVRLEQTMEFRTIFFGLNQGSPELRSSNVKGRNPFADLRVRQAVYQAIDIEAIRTGIMRGLAIPAGMIIQPGMNGYTPEFDARSRLRPGRGQGPAGRGRLPGRLRGAARLPEEPLPQRRGDLPRGRRDAGQGRHHRRSRDRTHGRAHRQAAGAADRLLHARVGDDRRSIPTTTSFTSTGATASTTRPATPIRASTS